MKFLFAWNIMRVCEQACEEEKTALSFFFFLHETEITCFFCLRLLLLSGFTSGI